MLRLLSSFLNNESYLYKNYASFNGKLFYKGYEIAFIYEDSILIRDDVHYFPIEFLLIYKFHKQVHDVPKSHWNDLISSSQLVNLFVYYRER